MTEWLILVFIVLAGVIVILLLWRFSEVDAEVSIPILGRLKIAGSGSRRVKDEEFPEAAVKALIEKHNEDFCRALVTQDIRYLSATMTPDGLPQAKQNIESVISSMQTHGWTSCRLVAYSLVSKPIRSGKRVIVDVDETWEYRSTGGQTSQSSARNTYTLVLVAKEWRIESCEVLSPLTGT